MQSLGSRWAFGQSYLKCSCDFWCVERSLSEPRLCCACSKSYLDMPVPLHVTGHSLPDLYCSGLPEVHWLCSSLLFFSCYLKFLLMWFLFVFCCCFWFFVFGCRASLCSIPGCPRILLVDHASLKVKEICLPLPLECWLHVWFLIFLYILQISN